MNNKLKIKVCGLTNPQNIKELAQLAPDYMGLIFYPKSPRAVNEKNADTLCRAIPENAEKVGVFVNELMTEVIRLTEMFNIKTIQLHGNESPEYCNELQLLGYTIIKAFGVSEDFDFDTLTPYENSCSFFLFDTKSKNHGGTGTKFNWQLLDQYQLNKPFFLSGGISADDAEYIKNNIDDKVYALDINSKFEIEPGLKDIELIKHFIASIRN